MQIKDVKPIKVGHSFYFTIPKQFITNGLIFESKRYDLIVEESKEVHK